MKRPIAGLFVGFLAMALPLCAAEAQTVAAGSPAGPVRLAQFDAPYGSPDGAVEVYVDQYGQRVFLDASGRIIGIEGSRRDRFRERRQRFDERRGAIIDAPPPPGVTLEGPADLGAVDPYGDRGYRNVRRPRSADPYSDYNDLDDFGGGRRQDNAPIEASPLPDAPAANPRREAELPQATPATQIPATRTPAGGDLPPQGVDAALPKPGESIIESEGQTIQESDPAPQVAMPKGKNVKVEVAALQILLDRAGMSPGVIDGRMGGNVNKAVAAYREKFGRDLPTGDSKALAENLDETGGPAIVEYEITAEDVAGPYVASIPSDYGEKAQLPALSYERVSEKLAEKFHMDEEYLKEINPGADFNRQGTRIKVANVGTNVSGGVAKIIADKGREQVRAYGADGTLLAAYPATIGSSDTPSPTGTVEVSRIAFDPTYTYNPKINFKQGANDKILTIPAGPNGPVGSIWIALSKPTYGIHGTPEPSKIGKTNSHGCVRLTNWDATELAKMVKPGVTVEFME
ncbi:L,D-transpeptidase [Aurantimonas sp. VKM B-3413]|uniref:L,D-transpeptidase family protein n=1 Tax=Aurantimonas sp. VKM B-3413 TaxID=2779401 RepID=UPI001E4AC6BF|nr:L,D-transpeptidase [Aurantimonas sp. VKM B-3413]MCB8840024.1 L,D-transpeptidase [Aurantimonas sp. VKM B-3413]